MKHGAIFALYPNIVSINDVTAYDKDGNEVAYDMEAVDAKAAEMDAKEQSEIQAKADAKQSAIDKLAKLGLTPDEVKALLG